MTYPGGDSCCMQHAPQSSHDSTTGRKCSIAVSMNVNPAQRKLISVPNRRPCAEAFECKCFVAHQTLIVSYGEFEVDSRFQWRRSPYSRLT